MITHHDQLGSSQKFKVVLVLELKQEERKLSFSPGKVIVYFENSK